MLSPLSLEQEGRKKQDGARIRLSHEPTVLPVGRSVRLPGTPGSNGMETTVNPRCRPEIYNSHMLLLDRDAGASSSTGRTLVPAVAGREGLGRKGLFQASGKPRKAQQGKQSVALK